MIIFFSKFSHGLVPKMRLVYTEFQKLPCRLGFKSKKIIGHIIPLSMKEHIPSHLCTILSKLLEVGLFPLQQLH